MATGMFRHRHIAAVALLCLLCGPGLAQKQPPKGAVTGQQIMQQVYEQARIHANQQSDVRMLIYRSAGNSKVRKRRFKSKFRVFKDRSKSLIRLYSPPAQKGIGLLSETLDDKDRSDQWIYLPAFRAIRKINSQNRNDSFLGSDLTIADMAGRKPEQDRHKLIGEEKDYWIVESVPKDTGDIYSRFLSRIHNSALVAVEIQFFARDGSALKTLENKRIGKFDGMFLPLEVLVSNVQTGGRTELIRSDIDIRSRIGKREVGLRGLEAQE